VSCDGFKSKSTLISLGVPRVTVRPLIFLIYVNHILNISCSSTYCRIISFADDTTVLLPLPKNNISSAVISGNSLLNTVFDAFTSLDLAFNAQKTKVLVFRSPRSTLNITNHLFHIGQNFIDNSERAPLLGISLTPSLTWSSHLEILTAKCTKVIFLISRLRQLGIPHKFLIFIYKALFIPVISYCITIWGSAPNSIIDRVQVLQNDALRAIAGVYRSHSGSLLRKNFALLSVRHLYLFRLCLQAYRIFHGVSRNSSETDQSITYRLRSQSLPNLSLPRITLEMHRNSLNFSIPYHWNSLPPSLRLIKPYSRFKGKLFDHFLKLE